jgi:nicotinamide-nucleotide amidase
MTTTNATPMLLNSELVEQYLLGLLAHKLTKDGYKLATAESCTGGLISAVCTSISGSSDWFDSGFVTYSNHAKTAQLGVDAQLIDEHGAVSEPVARAMAFGAVRHSGAQVSIAVTGVAGPTGGSAAKPVGTVWFGFSIHGNLHSEMRHFDGDRAAVREATVRYALQRVLALLEDDPHV